MICAIRKVLSLIILGLLSISSGSAQISYLDDDPDIRHTIDRTVSLNPVQGYHTAIKYSDRMGLLQLYQSIGDTGRTELEIEDWKHIINNIPERFLWDSLGRDSELEEISGGFWKNLYKDSYFLSKVMTDDFMLSINPIIHFALGNDEGAGLVFQNTRGIKIRGVIDKKVYFYTSLYENQRKYLNYIEREIQRINALPGQGFFKPYQSRIINSIYGHDYLNGQAYVGWKVTPSIDMQFGHGRHFIGDGIRSLLLSDYANNYFYLKISTQVWKFHYQNIFAELSATSSLDNIGDQLLPKKYMAAHFLDYQINSKLSIGIFESVVYGRAGGLELQYLNPIILYRSVERMLDSPDNVFLGLNAKWIPRAGWQVYGQVMIDELRVSEVFNGSGWWGNKIAYQLGLKYFNVMDVDHLDLQIEHNTARPYTYTHRNTDESQVPVGSYTNFNQSLAHPYGANFRETILRIRYQPRPRWWTELRLQKAYYGADDGFTNVGYDILRSYEGRDQEYGNRTGQGIRQDINLLHFVISYRIAPNFNLDLRYLLRSQKSANEALIPGLDTNYWGIGFRLNVAREDLDF